MESIVGLDHTGDDVFEKDWEDQADELLTWSKGLDFEEYQDTWFTTATSRPAVVPALDFEFDDLELDDDDDDVF